MRVYVVEVGSGAARYVAGAYASAQRARDAHPIPEKPKHRLSEEIEPGWKAAGPSAWENGLGEDEAADITAHEVRGG